jgi:DNA-binding beta-propeller fold protein YncE
MRTVQIRYLAFLAGAAIVTSFVGITESAHAQQAPTYVFDPAWPKPLPNRWKWGGVTGLAVASDDTIWVLHRPQDLSDMELIAERAPPVAECCVLPPSMIHLDQAGNVIGSFDAPAGHGMDVDADGYVYIGQDTVRKYDPRTGAVVAEIARTPEREGGGRVGLPAPSQRSPGQGTMRHAEVFMPAAPDDAADVDAARVAARAFRQKYPPETPMIVGGLEEIRIVEEDDEIYVADNYLGGRVLVFDLASLEFKRGWGAYGKPLAEISIDDADHSYTPNGEMAPDFVGHLTVNVSRDGLVYAADRVGNRIHVTTKQGEFRDEFVLAPGTGGGGSAGGVAFSPDAEQRFLYISDRMNNKVWLLDRRTGDVLGHFGSTGENGGQFFGLHMIAVDSSGAIYTGEVDSFRVQRFVPGDSTRGTLLLRAAELQ